MSASANEPQPGYIIIANFETHEGLDGKFYNAATGKGDSAFEYELGIVARNLGMPVIECPVRGYFVTFGDQKALQRLRESTNGIYSYALTGEDGYKKVLDTEVEYAAQAACAGSQVMHSMPRALLN